MKEDSEVEKLVKHLASIKKRQNNLRGLEAGLNLQHGAEIQKRRLVFHGYRTLEVLSQGEAIELASYLRFKQGELDQEIRDIENKLNGVEV